MRHAAKHTSSQGIRTRRAKRAMLLATLCACASALAGPATPAGAASASVPPPVNTGAPALAGSATVGSTLTCSQGSWANNPTSFAYTWLRNGSAISGQSADTYTLQSADRGTSVACKVTAATNAGEYTISDLPSGSYKVSFSAPEEGFNFLSQFFNGKPIAPEANAVGVIAGSITSGINAALIAGGQISGRVTSAANGDPLAGVGVSAGGAGGGGFATTNAAGEYSIGGLPSGSYVVLFIPPQEAHFEQLYYSGKASNSEANPVSVSAGAPTGGIDAALQAVPVGAIEGKVVTHVGATPLHGVEVTASGREGSGRATTNANGQYTISGLPSGSYTVKFAPPSATDLEPRYYSEAISPGSAKPVEVKAPGVTNEINATLFRGGTVHGTVKSTASATPIAGVMVNAGKEASTTTNASGEYTLAGLVPGSYTLEFSPSYGLNYLAESHIVTIKAEEEKEEIAFLKTAAQISGRVTSATGGAPLAGVYALAQGAGGFSSFAYTNANGEYTISGLKADSYTVEFEPGSATGNYLIQYYNSQPTSIGATSVTLGEAAAASSINAALLAGGQITGRVTSAAGATPLAGIEVAAAPISGAEHVPGGFQFALTNGGGDVASATSSALSIRAPSGSFARRKGAAYNAKTDNLEFFFTVAEAGTFHWALGFKNSDVGYADALQISSYAASATRCKAHFIRHKRRCVPVSVTFASGSATVAGGKVTLKIHASAKALKALRQGHTLHVSATFTFKSSAGGRAVIHTENVTVKPPRKRGP